MARTSSRPPPAYRAPARRGERLRGRIRPRREPPPIFAFTRPVAHWLDRQLDLPAWSRRVSKPCPRHASAPGRRPVAWPSTRSTQPRAQEGGTPALRERIPRNHSRRSVRLLARGLAKAEDRLIYESWVEAARAQVAPRIAARAVSLRPAVDRFNDEAGRAPRSTQHPLSSGSARTSQQINHSYRTAQLPAFTRATTDRFTLRRNPTNSMDGPPASGARGESQVRLETPRRSQRSRMRSSRSVTSSPQRTPPRSRPRPKPSRRPSTRSPRRCTSALRSRPQRLAPQLTGPPQVTAPPPRRRTSLTPRSWTRATRP